MARDPDMTTAEAVARAYCRRCWWAEPDDLAQQARLTAILAAATWDDGRDVPLTAYTRKAVRYALARYLWALSSPVSGKAGRGQRRASGDVFEDQWWSGSLGNAARAQLPEDDSPEEVVDQRRSRRLLSKLVKDVLRGTEDLELGLAVLVGDWRPREVAEDWGVEVRRVYRATARVKRRVAASSVLRAFWKGYGYESNRHHHIEDQSAEGGPEQSKQDDGGAL